MYLTINIANNQDSKNLLKLLSKLSYIEIEAEKELTAKEEHEQVKQIMLTGSKRFVTNFLLKNEH